MPLTRRQFAAAGTSLVTLTILGCDNEQPAPARPAPGAAAPPPPPQPFLAGPPAKYAQPGVYTDFMNQGDSASFHRVWMVSDGRRLVALHANCTHTGCLTEWDAQKQLFTCPCHRSRFDTQGVQQEGARAKRPLERCTIALVEAPEGPQVRVDPNARFAETADWENEAAWVPLAAGAATQPA